MSSQITDWDGQKLQQLFHVNQMVYWDGQLQDFEVADRPLEDCLGRCDRSRRRITIDVGQHDFDHEIQATLLHEMAHAACDRGELLSHGYGFWRELERLLELGAPVAIGFAEMPHIRSPINAVPERFPLCRMAAQDFAKSDVNACSAHEPLKVESFDKEEARRIIHEAGIRRMPWRFVGWYIGSRWNLLDVGGYPVNADAERILCRVRDVLEEMTCRVEW
jgi:SprT-like family